jgi:hypothetical protein
VAVAVAVAVVVVVVVVKEMSHPPIYRIMLKFCCSDMSSAVTELLSSFRCIPCDKV